MASKRMKLYKQGLSDQQIATACGYAKATIRSWRVRRGLKANAYKLLSDEEEKKRRKLHSQGFNDMEAAKKLGITTTPYREWRERRGLTPNQPHGGKEPGEGVDDEETRMLLYKLGLSDTEIARRVERARPTIYHWRKVRGLPSNYLPGGKKREKKIEKTFEKINSVALKFGYSFDGTDDEEFFEQLRR